MCQCGEDTKRSLMHDQQLSEREKQSGVNSNQKCVINSRMEGFLQGRNVKVRRNKGGFI